MHCASWGASGAGYCYTRLGVPSAPIFCVWKKKQLQERRRGRRRETRWATKRADGAITPIGMSLIYSHISFFFFFSRPVGASLPWSDSLTHTYTAIFVRDLLDGVAFSSSSSSFLYPFALCLVAVVQTLLPFLQCDASCSVFGSKRQAAAGGAMADAYCPQLWTRTSQAGGRHRVEKNDDVQAVKGREGNYANCYTHAHAKWGKKKETHNITHMSTWAV